MKPIIKKNVVVSATKFETLGFEIGHALARCLFLRSQKSNPTVSETFQTASATTRTSNAAPLLRCDAGTSQKVDDGTLWSRGNSVMRQGAGSESAILCYRLADCLEYLQPNYHSALAQTLSFCFSRCHSYRVAEHVGCAFVSHSAQSSSILRPSFSGVISAVLSDLPCEGIHGLVSGYSCNSRGS
jgi:hypothetical protein